VATYNYFGTYLYEYKNKKVMKENLDFIIFSGILVVLFILFGISTVAEFNRMSTENFDSKKNKGGVESLKNFVGKIFGS
jgi:hypothetical protein